MVIATSNHTSAFIVAKPGPLQVGLRALLIAMPQIGSVHGVDDLSTAIQMELESQPVVVLLDGDVSGEIGLAVKRVRLRWPHARLVFLANDVQQEKRALDAGADAVLLKGSPPARLMAVLVRLLGQPERQREEGDDTVGVSVQVRRGWLPRWLSRFGRQCDAMLRGRDRWPDRRGRARAGVSYQAMRR